ncbi:MAG: Na+/H+ antiporter subunit D [Vicinamibacterales bacterium]|nr:Na+/H+ antiporter subunit D [Vicinamibacterales bacterium]
MASLLVLPIVTPLGTAVLALFLWRHRRAQQAVSLLGAAALLAWAVALLLSVSRDGIQATAIGNWPAPFGITLVADLLSAMMVTLAAIVGAAVAVYSVATIDARRESFGYHPIFHVLLAGVCGAFLTGDLFNLYVWFEVLLISSFVLMGLGGERGQLEGSVKYVTLNLLSSALFLAAVGVLYGTVGTLNMADLAVALQDPRVDSRLTLAIALLLLVAFGIKAAMFPVFAWLPASYHTPPAAVAAVFAGLLTKVGVYALVRVFTLIFTHDTGVTHGLILVLSGLTMVSGVLGAAAQGEFRRVLSFHIISQIGYMLMGLGLYTRLALAGTVFYLTHHIIVKTNLFLVSGIVHRLKGTLDLASLGGLYRTRPILALLFLVPALSLAGLPPLSGFWAKLLLVQAGLEAESYSIVVVALVVSLLTLYSMTKLWTEAFWKAAPDAAEAPLSAGEWRGLLLPVAALALLTVVLGLGVEPVLALSLRAAEQLLNPAEYIRVVLGGRP